MSSNIDRSEWLTYTLFVEFGDLSSIIKWGETSCAGDWTFSSSSDLDYAMRELRMGSYYDFVFENTEDLTLFILRWT